MIYLACVSLHFLCVCILDWIIKLLSFLFTIKFHRWIQLKQGGDKALYENKLLTSEFFKKLEVFSAFLCLSWPNLWEITNTLLQMQMMTVSEYSHCSGGHGKSMAMEDLGSPCKEISSVFRICS